MAAPRSNAPERTLRSTAFVVVCALVLAGGCQRRDAKHVVERLDMQPQVTAGELPLGLSDAQVRQLFIDRLHAQGRFELLAGRPVPKGATPVRMALRLERVREVSEENPPRAVIQVSVALALAAGGKEPLSFEVSGVGDSPRVGEGLDELQDAGRKALAGALTELAEAAHVVIVAARRSDSELEKQLSSPVAREREAAVQVLAERKSPAAAPALIAKLGSSDSEEVRRAIGGLIELREQKAVPALIDLARAQDPVVVREIVFAVGEIGGDEAEAFLYTVAQGHDEPAIRKAAEQALEELKARKARARRQEDER